MRDLQPGRLLADERGQSVQVGAAILLGFVVIAITMYQVQVVPDQNAEVEFNHNQEVRHDMTELRNAIHNAGTTGTSTAVSVNLGTQYPPRTIFLNPPPPRGRLQTESIGNISISNATVAEGDYTTDGDTPQEILDGSHATSRISYTPYYTEFDGAPTTIVEHSLGFNTFDNNVSDPITPQGVVNGDSITLTVLRGNVSDQSTSATSIDPRTVTATDEIDIESQGGPITLDLPTKTPAVWNETLGETFDTGESDARVASWNPATNTIRVALDRSSYTFQMAMVGVGNGVPQSDRYDVDRTDGSGNGNGGAGGNSSYSLEWDSPQDSGGDAVLPDCDAESCEWDVGASDDDTLELSAALDPEFDDTDIEFAVDNTTVGSISPQNDTTGPDGSVQTELTADNEGTVHVRGTTDGAGDVIEIEVTNMSSGTTNSFESSIVDQSYFGSNGARYEVSYDVTDVANFDSVEVTVDNLDSGGADDSFSSTDPRNNFEYGWSPTRGGTNGDNYEITIDVLDASGNVIDSRTETDLADGTDPAGNDDLSETDSPTYESVALVDSSDSSGADYLVRYDVSDPAGKFSETEVLFVHDSGSTATAQASATDLTGWAAYSAGGTNGDQFEIIVQLLDDDGIVVDQQVISDTADGSVDGNDPTALNQQVNKFGKKPGQDSFSVQAQLQDQDGDNDLVRIDYVITDSSNNVIATATRSGSGQQIQPGNDHDPGRRRRPGWRDLYGSGDRLGQQRQPGHRLRNGVIAGGMGA